MTCRYVHTHLPYLLARASHALWSGFEPRLREQGLGSLEWRILATLSDSEPLPVGQLALEVLAQQPTVSKTVDRLASQGWIERRSDPSDARRQRVALTLDGQARVAPLLQAATEHQTRRLRELGVDDPGQLEGWLRGLVRQFDAADRAET
jgi:DNA-binding MarR family transcriptional regulator